MTDKRTKKELLAEIEVLRRRLAGRSDLEQRVAGRTRELEGANRKLRNEIRERRRVEEALRRNTLLFKGLLDNSQALIFIKDLEGKYLLANSRFDLLSLKDSGSAFGKTAAELFPGEMADAVEVEDRIVARTKSALTRDKLIDVHGEQRVYSVTKFPLLDEYGKCCAVCGVATDITAHKRTEDELKKALSALRTTFDTIPGMLRVVDREFRILDASDSLMRHLGAASREDVLGRRCYEVLKGRSSACSECITEKVFRTGCTQTRMSTPEEEDLYGFFFKLYAAPLRDEYGEVGGAIQMIMDVSDIRRMEEALRQSETNLSRAQRIAKVGSWSRDIGTGELWWSEEMALLYGYEPVNKFDTFSLFVRHLHPEDRDRVIGVIEGAVEGRQGYDSEYRIIRNDGEIRVVRAQGEVEFDGQGRPKRFFGTTQDITDQVRLEKALRAAKDEAETANRAKSAFLANMSHEIRTPMNAILGYLALILQEDLEPRQRERLEVVEGAARTLLTIINDILDYSKIEAGKFMIRDRDFDLHNVLETLVKEQQVLASERGLELDMVIDPAVPRELNGDPFRLRQILLNLVNNAIKYTEVGRVEVSVAPDPEAEPVTDRVGLVVTVRDTGIGIPEDQQRMIFESFTQVDSGLTKKYAGTGLGLAISKKLADLLGGGLSFESRAGEGSVFRLRAPFRIARGASGQAGAETEFAMAGAPELPSLRILLAEDNKVNQLFAVDLLQERGHRVTVAENGAQAVEAARDSVFDLVLMDIQMPVMDGMAATREIRAASAGATPGDVPILGLSAYAMTEEVEGFLSAGLDGYVTKPIDPEHLFMTIALLLDKRGRLGPARGARNCPATVGYVDEAALGGQYKGKAKLFGKVVDTFSAEAPGYLADLSAAARSGDWERLLHVSHVLRGNSLLFGAWRLKELLDRVDTAGRKRDAGRLMDLVPDLILEVDGVAGALKRLTDNL
ncbi:MAG: PAS domain-containing protein [Desulfovibrionaceae bacterium]|nr:PAS domain-containing protein [Desulfovibrionaceae bacterium]